MHLLEHGLSAARDVHEAEPREAARDDNSGDWQAVLRAVREDARRLSPDGETVKDTTCGEQERVAGGERGREHTGVDECGEDLDTGTPERDDVRRLRGGTAVLEQRAVVVGDEHARDEDAQNIEDKNTPEHTTDGLGDVPARGLGLRGGDRDKLHTLEREGCLDEDGDERKEAVEANVLRRQAGRGDGAWVMPVLSNFVSKLAHEVHLRGAYAEPNSIMVGASAEIYDETRNDKEGNQENCPKHMSVSEVVM